MKSKAYYEVTDEVTPNLGALILVYYKARPSQGVRTWIHIGYLFRRLLHNFKNKSLLDGLINVLGAFVVVYYKVRPNQGVRR